MNVYQKQVDITKFYYLGLDSFERKFFVNLLYKHKQAQESLVAAMNLNSVCHSNYCLSDFKLQLATCNLQYATFNFSLQPVSCDLQPVPFNLQTFTFKLQTLACNLQP